jgi:predicted small secreted protein
MHGVWPVTRPRIHDWQQGDRTVKNPIHRLAALFVFMAGCLSGPGVSETSANLGGVPTVSASASSYTTGQAVTVTWSDLTTNQHDWIGIAPVGSDALTVVTWAYTNGLDAGSHAFSGLPNGSFVARAFSDDGYTMIDESAPFDVVAPSAGVVSTNASTYSFDSDIVVTWSGLPGNANDWISIAPQGAAATTATRWVYTGGATSGSFGFESPGTGGAFVARAYLDDSYTMIGESAAFLLGTGVSASKSAYTTAEPIVVNWENLPTNQFDWIAIAPAGSPSTSVTTWVYTNGVSTGQHAFGALGAGTYVVRAFENNSYTLLDESDQFTVGSVGGSTVSSDSATYAPGADITVTWSGLPGNQNDWIAIAPDGSGDTSVTVWVYTAGQAAGSHTFSGGVGAGSYVVRAFEDNSYSKLGQSSVFMVQ